MDKYNLVIIGAGIAGCGLAYNLKKSGYNGSVLIIDKEKPGANSAYGIRTVYEDTIKNHSIPYLHKYKSLKIGLFDKILFECKDSIYLIDYQNLCEFMLKNSDCIFKKEKAKKINQNILVTDKNKYTFNHLIDCSGANFFLKKRFNQKLPFKYWLVNSKVIKKNFDVKDIGLSEKSCYFMFSDTNFVEDFYPLKDSVLQGDWSYEENINFRKIHPHKQTFLKKIPKLKVIKSVKTCVPVSPVFPISFGNYTCLGDSFGSANPNVGIGVDVILDSSKSLAELITSDKTKEFEREWKKKYFIHFTKILTSKLDRYHNQEITKRIKNYPSLPEVIDKLGDSPYFFENIMKNKLGEKWPKELKGIFPKKQILFLTYYYLFLRMKYSKENFFSRIRSIN